MLKARVIPCLDVKDGRVVKGVSFVDLRDAGDPVEQAKIYDAAGADELCFLDITASHENRGTILDVVARTADCCFMPLTVGGGVRTIDDVRQLLLAGADKVAINTSARAWSWPPHCNRHVGSCVELAATSRSTCRLVCGGGRCIAINTSARACSWPPDPARLIGSRVELAATLRSTRWPMPG